MLSRIEMFNNKFWSFIPNHIVLLAWSGRVGGGLFCPFHLHEFYHLIVMIVSSGAVRDREEKTESYQWTVPDRGGLRREPQTCLWGKIVDEVMIVEYFFRCLSSLSVHQTCSPSRNSPFSSSTGKTWSCPTPSCWNQSESDKQHINNRLRLVTFSVKM